MEKTTKNVSSTSGTAVPFDKDNNAAKERKEKKDSPLDWLFSIVITAAVTWFILNFIIINANIPSSSMENTIMTGDRVIGLRFIKDYSRGDIVIFPDPEETGRYLIKRIIGLPGETLQIKESEPGSGIADVYINGTKLTENYLPEPMLFMEELTIEIPEDGYFMMGDNRNHSFDARFWERQIIYKDEIIGVAKFRYWPFTNAGLLR